MDRLDQVLRHGTAILIVRHPYAHVMSRPLVCVTCSSNNDLACRSDPLVLSDGSCLNFVMKKLLEPDRRELQQRQSKQLSTRGLIPWKGEFSGMFRLLGFSFLVTE
jgi:hypothetical protein